MVIRFRNARPIQKWFYGAKSRKALADYEAGSEAGPLMLSKYEVPKSAFRRGDKQAVFMKSKAKLINRRRPDFCDKNVEEAQCSDA